MRGTKRQTLITEPKPDGETQTSYGYGGTLIDDPKSTPPQNIADLPAERQFEIWCNEEWNTAEDYRRKIL